MSTNIIDIMANKGLSKRYAKMGFKKGWVEFKKSRKKTTSPKKRTPVKTRKVNTVAKKKSYRKARTAGGKYKPIIDGVAVGLIERFAGQYIPVPGAIKIGYGIFRKNNTITTLGALELGQMLLSGNGGNSSGGVR